MMIAFSVLALLLPGYFLSSFISNKSETRLKNILLISLSIFPQILLLFDLLTSIPITKQGVVVIVLILNILTFYFFKKKQISESKITDFYPIVLALISIGVFIYSYFIFKKISPTADIFNLFFDSSYFIKNGSLRIYSDRSFVFIYPTIIYHLSGLTIEFSYKFYALLYFVLISQTTYLISKSILKNKHQSFLISLLIIFSEAFFNKILTIVPFTLGLITLYSIVEIFISNKKLSTIQQLFIFYLLANIFNLHGVIAYGSLLIILFQLIIHQKKNILRNKQTYFLGIIIFISLSQPLLYKHSWVVAREISSAFRKSLKITKPQNHNISSTANTPKPKPENIYQDWTNAKDPASLSKFPLYKDAFVTRFSFPIIILSLYGVYISTKHKNNSTLHLFILTFFIFLATQQKLFGLDWFSSRFIYFLSPGLFIFSIYGINSLIKHLEKLKIILPKTTVFILLPLICIQPIKRSISFVENLTPVISQQEYDIYTSLSDVVSEDETIFIISAVGKWLTGLDQETNYYFTIKDMMCSENITSAQEKNINWKVNRAFSIHTETIKESVGTIKEYTQGKNYFVLLNTNHDNCINPDLFLHSHYEFLVDDEENGIYLLKSK